MIQMFLPQILGKDKMVVKVQDKYGKIFTVENGTCVTCGHHNCWHTKMAAKLDGDKGLPYVAKSGLHKELRIGNITKALAFARICERFNKGSVKWYLRKIIFEETRNLDLFKKIIDTSKENYEDIVELFCRSKKDWELDWDCGWFTKKWVNTLYDIYFVDDVIWPDDIESYIKQLLIDENFDELYKYVVACDMGDGSGSGNKDVKKRIVSVLIDHIMNNKLYGHEYVKMFKLTLDDEMTVLFEIVSGIWNNEANSYPNGFEEDSKYDIPAIHDYVYDIHTWVGKVRMRKVGGTIDAGKKQPKGIDLRISGAEAGTFWRYEAVEKFGRIDIPWENISVEKDFAKKINRVTDKTYMDCDKVPREVNW